MPKSRRKGRMRVAVEENRQRIEKLEIRRVRNGVREMLFQNHSDNVILLQSAKRSCHAPA